jgi:hypothetical protein
MHCTLLHAFAGHSAPAQTLSHRQRYPNVYLHKTDNPDHEPHSLAPTIRTVHLSQDRSHDSTLTELIPLLQTHLPPVQYLHTKLHPLPPLASDCDCSTTGDHLSSGRIILPLLSISVDGGEYCPKVLHALAIVKIARRENGPDLDAIISSGEVIVRKMRRKVLIQKCFAWIGDGLG